jgi:glycosyltransferase involved in cell wall biosynthesis
MIKVSVLINNYNYGKFIKDAIDSVLNQTYQNFELIIVDDGSSDSSREVINSYNDSRIKKIFKQNGGQASALNVGIEHCKGDIISFLDSDDEFYPTKLEEVVKVFQKGYEYIINDTDTPTYPFKYGGYNLFLVYYLTYFCGNVTSSISISKKLADKIFPIKNEEFFRIRADDVIVFYAGMVERGYFLDKVVTKYRLHGQNLYMSNKDKFTPSYKYKRDIELHKLKKEILDRLNISKRFFENGYLLYLEFLTHSNVDTSLKKLYLRVLWFEMEIPFLHKIKISYKILKEFR